MFRSTGILRYSPKRLGEQVSDNWWLVLDCDTEIGRYYRRLYFKAKFTKIQRAGWKEHITVIRNEEPIDNKKYLWQKYDGQEVEFLYSDRIRYDNAFIWLDIECDSLLDIREELGLKREPKIPFHLTIGNFKCLQNK